ncbi:MAG: hypothetical protein KAJ24_06870, partial [Candidatus Aenigmarchaeota archaeon]|nr:hypothetical protein [Candidatus Aenigmarchaeota archaeon]
CLAGKVSGARKRTEKFMRGNLKKSGHSRDICTNYGQTTANLRPGVIGIKVRIMHSLPDVLLVEKRLKAILEKPAEEEEKETQGKGKKDATIELVKTPAAETETKDAAEEKKETPKDEKKKDHETSGKTCPEGQSLVGSVSSSPTSNSNLKNGVSMVVDDVVKEEAPKKEPVKEKAKPKADEKKTEPAKSEEKAEKKAEEPAAKKEEKPVKEEKVPEKQKDVVVSDKDAVVDAPAEKENKESVEKESPKKGE